MKSARNQVGVVGLGVAMVLAGSGCTYRAWGHVSTTVDRFEASTSSEGADESQSDAADPYEPAGVRIDAALPFTPAVVFAPGQTPVLAGPSGSWSIVTGHSGLCVEAEADGELRQRPCLSRFDRASAQQQFQLIAASPGIVQLRVASSNQCVQVAAGSSGARLTLARCKDAPDAWQGQAFSLERGHGGTTRLVAQSSGQCVEVPGGSIASGAALALSTCSAEKREQELLLAR